ncbi:tripartite tricarboxylate transporter substrate binding protein [Pseudorhodoferax sp. Leaf274]|uniref:Bug family tripartite tricarboxylate transporter substrate binding protein n=1 Tax=Pseudorhodoferax sp. Leaf274 TaxID=1736318 RepID=UPI000703285F|nr:tripartite tricarboxylate transporter substrate-binding protein [Pseudorhodoferax sp. Leaf274]KQP49475.1 ABC transporter substrate-binding protein [Pseudorhodoferax sp. Leaf274]
MKNVFASIARIALATACAAPALGWAQAYPARPIQLVIPFPPGGAVDVVGRLVAKSLGERLGQPVVADNRAGAGTVVGAVVAANAAADGYTLLISSGSTFTINPALNPKLPYDAIKSFEPLGMTARVPLILLAHPSVAANDFGQLLGAVRAAPDKFVYGSFGNGTTGHFAGEMLWERAGVKLTHIPYKGSAPAMTDLVGGQIPLSVDTVAAALPQLKAGKVKAIAVLGESRAPQLPQVPTIAESGYAGFAADSWLAVVAPRGLPAEVRTALQKAIADTAAAAELQKGLIHNGLQPAYEPGEAVAARIEEELPRMRATVRRAGMQN